MTLYISDANGCQQTVTATINLNSLPLNCQVSGAGENRITEGTSITLSENSGYSIYEWTNSNGELLSNNSQFSISPTQSDMYNLYVKEGGVLAIVQFMLL